MLNPDALQQLSQLKKSIEESKDIAEGVVRGTQNRFGFVALDDGREAFLPPEEMQRVLPGDRVKVSLTENDKKKHEAKLEKLIASDLKEFVGRYVEKGKNHFVCADHPQLSRWFFVPPSQRKNFKSGDFASGRIVRHPFGDGKAQIKITAKIGKADDIGIERQYMIHKHKLATDWNDAALQQAKAISKEAVDHDVDEREDLRDLHFVTIDAESTQDMDDALYAEVSENGWTLYAAIADPAAGVDPGTPLDIAARERASSVYFPGLSLPMFPVELSQGKFSLFPEVERPALVCKQHISPVGEIVDFSFSNALIRSRHKLSYQQVADFLEKDNTSAIPEGTAELLRHLHAIAKARNGYRSEHHVVLDDKADYVFRLNKQQKIESIELRQTTLAHQVVEEAMLATNCSAGAFLAAIGSQGDEAGGGLFSSHAGFRLERLQEIEQLLKKDKPELDNAGLAELENYRRLIRALQQDTADSLLLATLKRRLQPARISTEPGPHFGLGFAHYATVTSPIRRYQDLHNQRIIKRQLAQEQQQKGLDGQTSLANELQSRIANNRQACRQLEHWLLCEFMAKQVGREFDAKVVSVGSQGILVKLLETSAESFITLRNGNSRPKYDSLRMTLTDDNRHFHLEQELRVKLNKVDLPAKQMHFSLCEPAQPGVDVVEATPEGAPVSNNHTQDQAEKQ
ncbi:MAG: VacB/RNase II family 3'-5' exoribonuclease [Cellvibrionaceae bacterium]